MKRDILLLDNEKILWEGRPAPRCYTFRHWRHSLFGTFLLAICSYWQLLGFENAREYELAWLVWLPVPFLCFAVYLAVGHLLQARLEWNHVYYVITDRRLLTQRGLLRRHREALDLSDMTYFALHRYAEQLGTLQVYQGEEKRMTLHCLEYPGKPVALLEEILTAREQAR